MSLCFDVLGNSMPIFLLSIPFIFNIFNMKKVITTLAVCLFIVTIGFSQNKTDWDTWAENLAYKAERLAEKVSDNAERNAEQVALIAEDIAADVSQKFEDGDFKIKVKNLPKKVTLFSDHTTGYLGIHSDHISKNKAEKLGFENKYGSYVSKIVKNSAAEKAGLQAFDYVYGVNDQRTSNNQNLSDILEDFDAGEEVKIHYIRKGEKKTVNVSLGDYDDYEWEEDAESAFLGISPSIGENHNELNGVTVETINGSAAEEMGIKNGDVVKSINGYSMLDWDDVTTAISNLSPGDKVSVEVDRSGEMKKLTGNVKARQVENEFRIGSGGDWGVAWDSDESDRMIGGGAFMGVYIEKISEKKSRALGFDNPFGSYVTGIIKNTAADKAGLMPFDYIYGIDEYRVGENQYLGGILKKYSPNDKATIHFFRKGSKMSKELTFQAHSELPKEKMDHCQDPFFGIIEISEGHSGAGVKIKPVKNSTAMEMEMKEGDVVTHINGYMIYDWEDVGIAIDMLKPGEKIKVDYLRDGKKMSGAKNIVSYAEAKKCKDCDCGEMKDIVMGLGNDFKFNYKADPNSRIGIVSSDQAQDVSDMNVELQDLPDSEIQGLTAKGIDASSRNNLQIKNLRMSPNQDIGMFELQFDLDTEGQTMVLVYNDKGRAIYEYDLGKFSGDFMDNIDVSQNGPGTYYLHIKQGEKAHIRKILLTDN